MRPTIITDVSDSSRLMTEEIFGPVVCVVPFDTEEEVLIFLCYNALSLSVSLSLFQLVVFQGGTSVVVPEC